MSPVPLVRKLWYSIRRSRKHRKLGFECTSSPEGMEQRAQTRVLVTSTLTRCLLGS